MSRPMTLFYATLAGGVLVQTDDSDEGGQFRVNGVGSFVDPLCLFLTREESAQWAAVLTEYAEADQ